jgi:hypothetical protein
MISRRKFHALGAPVGHLKCDRVTTEIAGVGNVTSYDCECGKHFASREALVAHHKLQTMIEPPASN